MNFNDFEKPQLTEPGIKYFLNETLKQCHIYRSNYINTLINVGLFIGFLIILGAILLYKYKGRLTKVEKEKKDKEKQQYILSKVKQFKEAKRTAHQELISGLPNWDNEYDIINNKVKL
jgi:uncharacterized membrane protein YciS (DUF1049 family)